MNSSEISITTVVEREETGALKQKVIIQLPEGPPAEQLKSMMKLLGQTGEVTEKGPLAMTEPPVNELMGDYTLKTAIKRGDTDASHTFVTLKYFNSPENNVGAEIAIEQASPIKRERLTSIMQQIHRMGVEAIERELGTSISGQISRTATSNKAVVCDKPGVRQLTESRRLRGSDEALRL